MNSETPLKQCDTSKPSFTQTESVFCGCTPKDNSAQSPIIQVRDLTIGYGKQKNTIAIQKNLNLSIYQGELVCLIGPNGCGKSTLLRTMSGLQPPLRGEVIIDGLPLDKQPLKKRASLIALVLTERVEVANLTVFNLVSLGRNPYTDWLGNLTEEDKQVIRTAISQVHLEGYEEKFIDELSDGERQRAMIAKALVQDTPVILLDEPTAHLDLPNRVEVMILLHTLAKETNKAVILSTHELDLALQSSDKLWLMSLRDGIAVGMPEDLILDNHIQTVFANKSFYFDGATGNFIMKHPGQGLRISLITEGIGNNTFWTERALARNGFVITKDAGITVLIDEEKKVWTVQGEGVEDKFVVASLSELLARLNVLS